MTERITLTLYQHDDRGGALLLSPEGRYPEFVPKSLLEEPPATRLVSIAGQQLQKGEFRIDAWKARELGWTTIDDDRQGSMF